MTLTILDPRTGERITVVVTKNADGKPVWTRKPAA